MTMKLIMTIALHKFYVTFFWTYHNSIKKSIVPVDAKPLTIFSDFIPSFHILQSWLTKSPFESAVLAPNLLTRCCRSCSQRRFNGPKQETSSGWRTLVAWGGNFNMIILSCNALSVTGSDTCVMCPSNVRRSGRSLIALANSLNHSANTSVSIHPIIKIYEKPKLSM